jgi:glycine/D-amino acid oxidase-like deaminating enzyme
VLFSSTPGDAAQQSLIGLRATIFWLDTPARPEPIPPLAADLTCDLLVIGGGFSGLWTALLAKQRDPERDVVLVEAGRIADGASGRNGGFVSPSLTHGIANGSERWPGEMPELLRLGHANLDAIEAAIESFGIDCGFRRVDEISVAVEQHQVSELRRAAEVAQALGEPVEVLDAAGIRARVRSESYLSAIAEPGIGLVDPARLAWGLLKACRSLGVRVFEGTPVVSLARDGALMSASTAAARVTAGRVALATNAYPPLLRRVSRYVVPVYDYVLMSEPLTGDQWAAIGWDGREGMSDAGNQFHYYRTTDDGRILWGGYDAIYHRGNGFGVEHEVDHEAFARLAEHFFQTFPALEGLSFTHGWGGAIDTCSRFSPFWGTAHGGRTAYVAGYTGLGVGSSRFGAEVMLDLLDGLATERTSLEMVRSRPLPFPPEPLRSLGINWTTRSLAAADRNGGRRNLWLRALDRLGLGFDS